VDDPDVTVRRAAVGALGEIRDSRGAGRLVAALGSEDGYVAAFAAWSLGNLGSAAAGAVPDLVRALGGTFHSGRVTDLDFKPDVVVECTGVGAVIADSIQQIGSGGILCLTGIGAGGSAMGAVADTAAALVLKNNVIVGSVNANKRHWYRAGQNLANSDRSWLSRLITRREKPENFQQALTRQPDDVKVIIQFSEI